MIESIDVIGAGGRVGSTVSARLAERGVVLDEGDADLVLLCVPDRAIAEIARGIEPGPWVAHVSGGPHSPPSTPTCGASGCIRSSRSRRRAARSSSTGLGRR